MPRDLHEIVRPLIRRSISLSERPNTRDVGFDQPKFGGLPFIARGEEWPRCGNCSRSFTFVAQLSLEESHERLPNGREFVVVFYCFECLPCDPNPWDDKAWLARTYMRADLASRSSQAAPSDAEVLAPRAIQSVACDSLPSWQLVGQVDPRISDLSCALDPENPWEPYHGAVKKLVGEQRIGSQIGGYPCGPQGGSLMPNAVFVAQLDPLRPHFNGAMLLYMEKEGRQMMRMRIESC